MVKTATRGKKPSVAPKKVPDGESLAKSVFSLDAKTTVAQESECEENSFDAESISSTESLLLQEAQQREEHSNNMDINKSTDGTNNSPMPIKGDLFKDFDPISIQQRIRKEAAEVQGLGGGEFPSTEDLSKKATSASGSSVGSTTTGPGINMEVDDKVGRNESESAEAEMTSVSEPVNVEMDELDPDEIENIMTKTDDILLSEDEKAQLEYDDRMLKI